MNRMLSRIVCSSVLCLLLCTRSNAATPEYQLEAAFLFNFAQFIEWPTDAFTDVNSPLVIGVLGEDPFGSYLDDMVRGEVINGRTLIIERYRNANEIKPCHILFFGHSEIRTFPSTLLNLKGRSILTVSDMEGFARSGGMIRFLTVANKLRMRVNLDFAQAARLTISSKLLRRAEIINSGED